MKKTWHTHKVMWFGRHHAEQRVKDLLQGLETEGHTIVSVFGNRGWIVVVSYTKQKRRGTGDRTPAPRKRRRKDRA